MNFEVSASASGSVLPRTLPCRIPLLSIVFLNAVITGSGCSPPTDWTVALPTQHEAKGEQNYYANAHPYLDESLEQLIKRMPELKTIQPVPDQQALPTILEKTGEQVDDFFRKVVDLAALEEITEEKWGGQGQVTERLQMEDSYLILRSGAEMFGTVNEYRMDSKGNRLEEAGLNNGYFVTSNFALSHVYFSTAVQSESRFRYLGEEKVGPRDTYVVAFAQTPGEATVTVGLGVDEGRGVHASVRMLVQGIAWVDKSNFQIIRLRTDLLAPRTEIRLQWLTTVVTFDEVQLPGVATALWLPSNVQVDADFTVTGDQIGFHELIFRNEHRYSDYKSYRVSVKIVPDEVRVPAPSSVQPVGESDLRYYAHAHPYLEEPLDKLGERIPELKKIHPAADLQELPAILKKTASNVDSFFPHIGDIIAGEQITQQRLNGRGVVTASEHVRDSYLILRHVNGAVADIVEYRMDAKGNRMDDPGLGKGYFVTLGFALSCNYFSTAFQPESHFRYLGDQKLGPRDTYVVAFAQQPGTATLFVTMTGRSGTRVQMLMQGIAWVDKRNFQIIQLRTDLLAARPEIGLERLTTVVTLSKVQLLDVTIPLWLPKEVKVNLKFRELDAGNGQIFDVGYRNEHHYEDYRRYRVSVKINPTQ
jgi:hypothetical protein